MLSHKEESSSILRSKMYGAGGDHGKLNNIGTKYKYLHSVPNVETSEEIQYNMEAEHELLRIAVVGCGQGMLLWHHAWHITCLPQACALNAWLPTGGTISEVDLARGSRPLSVGPCPRPLPVSLLPVYHEVISSPLLRFPANMYSQMCGTK